MHKDLDFKIIRPGKPLSDFVHSFWYLHNGSNESIETTGLPDGLVDLSLSRSAAVPFRVTQLGGLTQYEQATIPPQCLIFCTSFKLPAVEYLFQEPVSGILNSGRVLPGDYWGYTEDDLGDFDQFVEKTSRRITELLPAQMDERKRLLFGLIYETAGAISVKELSEKVFWSSRQINRYFNTQFGISLKAYCNILRFRNSLDQIVKGDLFPEDGFFDQNHFIKEVKKFSGVAPKELLKNKNDRFILLSALKGR